MKNKIKEKLGNVHYLRCFYSLHVETLCGKVLNNILNEYEYTDEEVTCPACKVAETLDELKKM